ncbi:MULTISPECIES: DNA mismatch repair protein MutH [Carnobacterium]|uniref:DNA mismatch repair protein MutH n=1 Tax=Carnobacterium inhibens TaxID=147709 RepID=A0ABR7TBN7_9LACT|nr:DNA mismatch repair protein MutH [Carnobacterium inhibens]MBC9825344.1 DNA mismatch repair protein MutH [Carnobacterium inhibens]
MCKNDILIAYAQAEVDKKIQSYKGKKVSELKELFGMYKDNKASFVQLALKLMGEKGNQFSLGDGEINAVLKTVRLTGMEKPAEAMSFMPVDFDDWISDNLWKDSSLYKYFKEKTLVFFIFQQFPRGKRVNDSEMTFLDVRVWKMSDYDLTHGLKEVWEEVRYLIKENKLEINSIKQTNGRTINKNNLPSTKFNELGHLRPGAKNGMDTVLLPTGQEIVKQRFWFNIKYVEEIISL